MSEVVEAAKAEFTRAKDRMSRSLATTPDDRINWAPSGTSRTPIDQVAHAAMSISGMQDWFSGKPFPFATMQDLDAFSREQEKKFTTRDEVISLLDQNSAAYFVWLDSLTDDQLSAMLSMGGMTFPMSAAITFPADHIRAHTAQIDYIQTIYGDQDWHMG